MRPNPFAIGLAALLTLAVGLPVETEAQVDRLRRRAQRELEKTIEGAVKCALGDTACVEQAKKDGKPVVMTDKDGEVITDEQGNPVSDPEEAERRAQAPGEGVWRNYDFVPGDTVWKATDFTDEPIGRFPANQVEFVRGNMQIVEFEGVKTLEVSSRSVFRLVLPRALPDDFTVEFALRIPTLNIGTQVYFSPLETSVARYEHDYLSFTGRPGIYRKGREVSNVYLPKIPGTWVPVKLQVDSAYAILYVGTERAAQVPTANFARTKTIEFHADGNTRFRTYVKDIVVAVGLDDLYDALNTSGEFTTRGIFFDTDSDRLRPESTPVLQEILTTLQRYTDLRIAVEGHTDDQGDEAHNQDLSERRGRAVVGYLTANGIEASRLSSSGKGESAPVADNGTPEGRQQNRRVVLRTVK